MADLAGARRGPVGMSRRQAGVLEVDPHGVVAEALVWVALTTNRDDDSNDIITTCIYISHTYMYVCMYIYIYIHIHIHITVVLCFIIFVILLV